MKKPYDLESLSVRRANISLELPEEAGRIEGLLSSSSLSSPPPLYFKEFKFMPVFL